MAKGKVSTTAAVSGNRIIHI